MKKIRRRMYPAALVLAMLISLSTPVLAVVSEHDEKYLSSSQKGKLQEATNDWNKARANGDTAGMEAAHKAAEAIRATKNYSGGQDGSEYLPQSGTSVTRGGGGSRNNDYSPPVVTYMITASAGTGGSINPSGSTSVTSGGSKTYTITANTGYKIADVKVDGTSIGAPSTYTFSNVTSSRTISVTFASAASLSAGNPVLGDGGSSTLKSGVTKSGYGFSVSLPVTSSYVSGTTVTASYNFTSAKTVSLENVGGTWQFPMNAVSTTSARKIYIPVETKDGTYTITLTVKSLDPQASALTGSNVYLTSSQIITITIHGSMYEDDFTGHA